VSLPARIRRWTARTVSDSLFGVVHQERRIGDPPTEQPIAMNQLPYQTEAPDAFYLRVLDVLLADGTLSRADTVLVVCGGDTDVAAFRARGFEHVTISNLGDTSDAVGGDGRPSYAYARQNAEALDFPDGAFDHVFVHSGLHHLRCPIRGLTEMYRVARKVIVGFEPHLTAFTRLGVRLGFGQEYEKAAVYFNDLRCGGVADSPIPNFVYRFGREDIVRAIQTYAPIARHRVRFWFATRVSASLALARNPMVRQVAVTGRAVLELAGRVSPLLANNIAFAVHKPRIPEDLFPWLRAVDGGIVPDRDALALPYRSGDLSH
jgi:SAM-dependent methyltransferase